MSPHQAYKNMSTNTVYEPGSMVILYDDGYQTEQERILSQAYEQIIGLESRVRDLEEDNRVLRRHLNGQ